MGRIMTVFFGIAVFSAAWAQDQVLFNGKDLSGWTQRGGKAVYRVENGEIVGTSVAGTPNSFLCTDRDYGDFILELEVMVRDERINSGIQFRSHSRAGYQNGRVHGYQAEVDPGQRAWSGGIYDEARRGWLYPLSENPKARSAFRTGTWNRYRIEAIGSSLRTWVNGVLCADLVDDTEASGFIALQVHSIEDESMEGLEIRWRNIKISTENPGARRWPIDPQVREINYIPNTLSEREKRTGWRLLWDGRTSNGWRAAGHPDFPAQGWAIHDGVLSLIRPEGNAQLRGGDIVSRELFGNFELIVDFSYEEGANSGIKYFVDPDILKNQGAALGMEYQIIDDERHDDASGGIAGNHSTASLYDMIAAENLSNPGAPKGLKGPGEWNRARIVVRGGEVEHWLNHQKVVDFDRFSLMFRALVAFSKYREIPGFGRIPQGHILLQDHGDTVHFRNIKIREF
jgi:hypothetical protein